MAAIRRAHRSCGHVTRLLIEAQDESEAERLLAMASRQPCAGCQDGDRGRSSSRAWQASPTSQNRAITVALRDGYYDTSEGVSPGTDLIVRTSPDQGDAEVSVATVPAVEPGTGDDCDYAEHEAEVVRSLDEAMFHVSRAGELLGAMGLPDFRDLDRLCRELERAKRDVQGTGRGVGPARRSRPRTE